MGQQVCMGANTMCTGGIAPATLVKGGDYTREQVVGHEVVAANGGEVILIDILQGHSTTSLVERARGGKA